MYEASSEGNKFEKFEFNLSTLKVKRTVLFDDLQIEFPNLNQYYYGYKSRYCYLGYRPKRGPEAPPLSDI